MRARGTEIRVVEPTAMEDYHAHLVRLDRMSRLPGTDDRSIDAHCLELISGGAIVVGVFVNGVIRAGAEIVPDRTARRAVASITVETGYEDRGYERDLTDRIVDEARRYHIADLRVHEQDAMRCYRIPPFELKVYATSG
jgi:hypothetical protein